MQKVLINNIPFHSIEKNKLFSLLNENLIGERKTRHIVITNTESMYYANKMSQHRKYIEEAALSLCDGVAIAFAAKLQNIKIQRYHGPDFMLDVIKLGIDKGWKHYFLGGTEEVNRKLREALMEKYDKINIAGYYCPPFRNMLEIEEKKMISDINQSQADFLWVGLGLLKQEEWIAKFKNELVIPWNIGVGAAFDFHSGNKNRAPRFAQYFGIEWLIRMMKEPRMIPRNIRSLLQFFNLILSKIPTNRFSK